MNNFATLEHTFIGKWITTGEFSALEVKNVFHRQLDKTFVWQQRISNYHSLFRKQFELSKVPNKATLYFTADDYAKIYINGQLVAQGPTPGYAFHYFYHSCDITSYLKEGKNTIAIHSYYQGLINRVWVSGDNRHGVICDIVDDNNNTIVASDSTFKYHRHTGYTHNGLCGYSTMFLQCYDTNSKEYNFYAEDFDDSSWAQARYLASANDYKLFPSPLPLLAREEISPATIEEKENSIIIDFGAMYVGYFSFQAKGNNGDTLELRFAQELNDDASLRYVLRANCTYQEYFTLSGRDSDLLEEYDYKSFRYAQIIYPEGVKVDTKSIKLIARHMPFELKVSPKYQDDLSMKIWNLCVRSLEYGVQEQIQDCMEREKGYYLGDGVYTMITYCVLTKNFLPMRKMIDDFLRTSFINGGLVTCGNCSLMQEIAEYPFMMFMLLPVLIQLDDGKDFIKERMDQFYNILAFYQKNYALENGLLNNLDKWCVIEWPPVMRDDYDLKAKEGQVCSELHNVINAWYLGAIKWYNNAAKVLGEKLFEDEEKVYNSFIDTFYLQDKMLFCDQAESKHISIPGNIYAWFAGLAPNQQCIDEIIKLVETKRLNYGMLFIAFPMLSMLQQNNREDLVYSLLTDQNTWSRMLAEGATSTFEGWSKDIKWNTSLFHLTLSLAAVFMVEDFKISNYIKL